jgi:hypothetical protein
MATDQGPIATEAPSLNSVVPGSAAIPAVASPSPFGLDPTRSKSLKRTREVTPTGPTTAPKLARLAEYTAQQVPSIPPLTGAAALEEERAQREAEERLHPPGAMSENPSQKVLSDLRAGSTSPMSRPQDAPVAVTTAAADAEGAVKALQAVAAGVGNNLGNDNRLPTMANSVNAASIAAGVPVTESPGPLEPEPRKDLPVAAAPEAQMEDKAPVSLSYPGILPPRRSMAAPAPPPRSGSLPMASQNPDAGTRSPSLKKHKCPYCDTEFTRQHNLKSHLLTHSQEKPYICQDCQMRFRRLHDLKRHNKLHTGEKPHICPKCDRKFARGDALARHAKGAGGCAGRRTSQGSFGGDDDYEVAEGDDSAMSGVVYDGDRSITEEERRRLSLPGMKVQHPTGLVAGEAYGSHSSTYPPAGPRQGTTSGLFPPNMDRGSGSSSLAAPSGSGTAHTASASISSIPSAASGSLYAQSAMTESPKPLSPGGQSNQVAQDALAHARKRASTSTSKLGPSSTAASGGIGELIPFLRRFLLILF